MVRAAERLRTDAVWITLCVLGFGVAAAFARRYVSFHLGIPGHTGMAWIAVLVLGYLVTRRAGAGLGMGATAALLTEPLGVSEPLLQNLLTFGSAGLLLDLVFHLPRIRQWSLAGALLGGGLAHMAKFAVVAVMAADAGVGKNINAVGLEQAAVNHFIFGLAGGFAAALAFGSGNAVITRRKRVMRWARRLPGAR